MSLPRRNVSARCIVELLAIFLIGTALAPSQGTHRVMPPPGIRVGDVAPLFSLLDQENNTISLKEYRGKVVVLAFYGFAYNSESEMQLKALQTMYRRYEELHLAGTQVVFLALGVERSNTNQRWARQVGFEFPLLGDGASVARQYDLYDVATKSARRANCVINPDGLITEAQWDDDALEPAKLLSPPAPPPAGRLPDAVHVRPPGVRLSLGVLGGMLKSCVLPDYPTKAEGKNGDVVVALVIGSDGKIREAKTDGEDTLQLAAVDAAKQWIFRPYLLNGIPTAVEGRIVFRFDLPQKQPRVSSTPSSVK
jgi:mycoredoxin-dependent peroxiredoxin